MKRNKKTEKRKRKRKEERKRREERAKKEEGQAKKSLLLEILNFDIKKALLDDKEKFLYALVIVCSAIVGLFGTFSVSNLKEFIAVCIAALIPLLLILFAKGNFKKWAIRVYIPCYMILFVCAVIMQKPFFGLLENDPQTYYDNFSKGFYEYSIGNYDEALSTFRKLKGTVPEDEITDFYLWYMDAALRENDFELYTQLSKEVVDRIQNPTMKER